MKAGAEGGVAFHLHPNPELVAAAEGKQVIQLNARDDEMHACLDEGGKVDPLLPHEDVSRVLQVVLVDRVIHDPFEVAFVVAYFKG